MNFIRSKTSFWSDHGAFLMVFVFSIAIRCYQFTSVQFTYDEYSTLNRTGYNSFSELIDQGVKTDTHPALHQVFVHYWIQLFGSEPWIIKLPFLIAGILSILLVYLIATRWFGKTTGVLTAAFLSSTQIMVYYSEIARPYSTGLFLVLLLILKWDDFLFKKKSWTTDVSLVPLFVLTAMNHHFTMLMAGMIWLTTFLFFKKELTLRFTTITIASILLYLPHLTIFLGQLQMGGASTTTGLPDIDFLLHHFSFLFNYSIVFFIVFVLTFLALLLHRENIQGKNKWRYIVFLWWLVPMAIGYIYSYLRSPVLLDRVLIFSLPFLFMVIFSFGELKNKFLLFRLSLVLIISGIYSLVLVREHFNIVTHTGYEDVFTHTYHNYNTYPNTKCYISAINHVEKRTKELCKITSFQSYEIIGENTTLRSFKEKIYSIEEDHVSFAWTTQYFVPALEMLSIIRERFPFLIESHGYPEAEYYLFSKHPFSDIDLDKTAETTFQFAEANIAKNDFDREDHYSYNGQEFGIGLELKNPEQYIDKGDILCFSAELTHFKNPSTVHLTFSASKGDSVVFWRSREGYQFIAANDSTGYIHNSIRISDLKKFGNNLHISAGIWNPKFEAFEVSNFECKIIPGNHNIYGHLLPLTNE